MKKMSLSLCVAAILVLTLASCGNGSGSTGPGPSNPTPVTIEGTWHAAGVPGYLDLVISSTAFTGEPGLG